MHAVRARPLQTIKNNIEPDEHREEADTIPPRGVNPESRAGALISAGIRPQGISTNWWLLGEHYRSVGL